MAHHEGESFVDKVKNALGMGTEHRDVATPEEDGWAGVPEALEEDLDVANRPAGPDYGHREHAPRGMNEPMREPAVSEPINDTEFGVGLDRESMAGTGASNTGTGPDYDFERREVVDDEVESERRDLGI